MEPFTVVFIWYITHAYEVCHNTGTSELPSRLEDDLVSLLTVHYFSSNQLASLYLAGLRWRAL